MSVLYIHILLYYFELRVCTKSIVIVIGMALLV